MAVWHAMLNATGGLFFFRMVTGEDKARLGVLLSCTYVLLGAAAYVAWRRRQSPAGDEHRSATTPS